MSLRCGFGKSEISPPPEGGGAMDLRILGFWYDRAGKYGPVRDGLFARAAFFESDGEAACVVALDLIGDAVGFAAAIRERVHQRLGLPAERVMVACTHTHTSPETIGLTGHPIHPRWFERVTCGAVEAAAQAATSAAPCRLALGRAGLPGITYNRAARDGEGIMRLSEADRERYAALDDTLGVAALLREDGSIQGLLFNYACHPVCVQAQPFISADWPGAALARLEARHPAVFLNGACGDADPVFMGDYEDAQHTGREVAVKVEGLLETLRTAESTDRTPITVARRIVSLARRPVRQVAELERETRELESAPADRDMRAERLFDVREELALARRPEALEGEVQAIKIGPLTLAGVPGEMAACLAEDIRKELPTGHCWVIGYANGYLGYLVPRASYDAQGYETMPARWSPLAPGEAERLRDEAVALARSVDR